MVEKESGKENKRFPVLERSSLSLVGNDARIRELSHTVEGSEAASWKEHTVLSQTDRFQRPGDSPTSSLTSGKLWNLSHFPHSKMGSCKTLHLTGRRGFRATMYIKVLRFLPCGGRSIRSRSGSPNILIPFHPPGEGHITCRSCLCPIFSVWPGHDSP